MHLWPQAFLILNRAFSQHCSVFNAIICVVPDFQSPSCLSETKAKSSEEVCSHRATLLGYTYLSVFTPQQMTNFLSYHILFQGPCSVPEMKIKATRGLQPK